MSVPKNQRGLSQIEYFDHAYMLYENIVKFLLNDFGTKPLSKDLNVFVNQANMSVDDINTFRKIVEEYHIGYETSYPMWVLDHYRNQIIYYLDQLIEHITYAYSMYPNSMYEFNIRRQHQSDAISACNAVKHQLQLAMNILPANLEKFIPYIVEIDKEIEYLRTWRKDSNKLKSACYRNDQREAGIFNNKLRTEIIKDYERRMIDNQKFIFYNYLSGNYAIYTDPYGELMSSTLIPAVTIYKEGTDDFSVNNIVSFCLE